MEKSKVALISCGSYEEELVYRKIKAGISLLGGLESFIDKDENVLLKPNLLKRAETEKAVITHPVVVGAFARILQEEGYHHIKMGDSCGVGQAAKVIAGTGMDTFMEKYGIPVVDFSSGVKVPYPQGHQAKEFILAKEAYEADVIINICKMKTHALERITGAVKNMYGCVQGLHKAKGHTQYPSADSFARMLVDLNQLLGPRLYLMDGIVAMEGNGPGSGDPVPMEILLLGTDPVALDSVFCHLIHLKPNLVPTNYHGEKLGLGRWREEEITLLTEEGEITMAEACDRYGKEGFRVDRRRTAGKWNGFAKVFNFFQKKPSIESEHCIRCGICVDSCPVEEKAVRFSRGKDQPPVYDYRKCIRCFCCQEMCPQKAIKVK